MATIADALREIGAALALDGTLARLSRPADPPQVLDLPTIVVYAASGSLGIANLEGAWDGTYTVAIETHVERLANLEDAYAELMTYLPLVNRQIANGYTHNRFAGTVILAGLGRERGGTAPLRFLVEEDTWNGINTLSMKHELDLVLAED